MDNDFELVEGQTGSESQDQKELLQILAGEGGKIYPVLRNKDWSGIKYGSLFNPLIGTFENPKIVIAIAHDMPNNLVYIPYKSEFGHEGLNKIYEEAQKNLEEIKVPYEVFEHNGHFEVNASGLEFSSEFLLHKPFLKELHTILKSDEILVAVPKRGYFKAIAINTSRDLYNAFIEEYEFVFNSDEIEKPQITNGVFIIKNGEIKQRAELEKY